MANQLHHIEKLILDTTELIFDTTGRDYATSPGEAIEKLKKQQEIIQKEYREKNPIIKDVNYNKGNIKKGIHDKYVKDNIQRFGGHRRGYPYETELLRNGYTSFSGADATVSILFKYGHPVVIGETQTISYSVYTTTTPVYNLGTRKASGYVRGPRTIAGTIIFTVFDRHALIGAFHSAYDNYLDVDCLDREFLSDELPPFDLQVTFLNEYGQSAGLTIHDVRIVSEGQTMSIEDMITENTMQYVATDITLMQPDFVEEPI